MYIKKIYLKNIRCFEEFELEFKKRGESALFAADNGDGKTTLLRSIAMGLCDESSAAGLLRDTNGKVVRMGEQEGKIKITLDERGERRTITTRIVKTDAGFEILKQGHHSSPDLTTRATGTSADMNKTVFAGIETTRNPRGRSVQIRTNNADGRLRWLLLGRKRPQNGGMTARSVLKPPVCVSMMANNLPVVVTGKSIWEMSD